MFCYSCNFCASLSSKMCEILRNENKIQKLMSCCYHVTFGMILWIHTTWRYFISDGGELFGHCMKLVSVQHHKELALLLTSSDICVQQNPTTTIGTSYWLHMIPILPGLWALSCDKSQLPNYIFLLIIVRYIFAMLKVYWVWNGVHRALWKQLSS